MRSDAERKARTTAARATLGTAAALRKVEQLREVAEPRDRETAAEEVEQLREVLGKIAKALRAKG